jgi:hypothetical protein
MKIEGQIWKEELLEMTCNHQFKHLSTAKSGIDIVITFQCEKCGVMKKMSSGGDWGVERVLLTDMDLC